MMLINPKTGPSKRKPDKLPLIPKDGDNEEGVDEKNAQQKPLSMLQHLTIVKGNKPFYTIDLKDKITLNQGPAEEEAKSVDEETKSIFMEFSLADIKCFGRLGEGSSGVVEKAIHIPTRSKLALKVKSAGA